MTTTTYDIDERTTILDGRSVSERLADAAGWLRAWTPQGCAGAGDVPGIADAVRAVDHLSRVAETLGAVPAWEGHDTDLRGYMWRPTYHEDCPGAGCRWARSARETLAGNVQILDRACGLRGLVAELGALNAGLDHTTDSIPGDEALWGARNGLVREMWHLALRAGWQVGWDHDPHDAARPHVAVVGLPTGGQVRAHVGWGWWSGEERYRMPWDGTTRAGQARAIAVYLAGA